MGNDTVPHYGRPIPQFVDSPRAACSPGQLGLPKPAELRRYEPGQPLLDGPALVGGAPGGRLAKAATDVLDGGQGARSSRPSAPTRQARFGALVYDASGIADVGDLHHLYAFFHDADRAASRRRGA